METFALVRPEHLNHFGYLFGGQLLRWVDEFAWMAATRDFPGNVLVTRAMEDVEFRHQVPNGAILRFTMLRKHRGNTSLQYGVQVFARAPTAAAPEELVFDTTVVFVCVDAQGRKTRIGPEAS